MEKYQHFILLFSRTVFFLIFLSIFITYFSSSFLSLKKVNVRKKIKRVAKDVIEYKFAFYISWNGKISMFADFLM